MTTHHRNEIELALWLVLLALVLSTIIEHQSRWRPAEMWSATPPNFPTHIERE